MIRFASFNIISPIKSDTELLWAPDGIAFVFLRVLTRFPSCCWLGCAGDVLKRNRRKKKNERQAMAKAERTTGLAPSPPLGSIRRKHRGTEAPGMDSPVQQGRQISEQNNIRTCKKTQVCQAQISDKDLTLTSANVSIFHMMSIITPTVVIMKKSTVIHWNDNSANKTMQWS